MDSHKVSRANPVAFTRWPVTIIATIVYFALVIPVLVIHNVVPSAPGSSPHGLNITEAWEDLQDLTNGYHPYNSHRNDKVHAWLLSRIGEISKASPSQHEYRAVGEEKPDVFTFDDTQSNLTFAGSFSGGTGVGVYFEGTNIIVYVRGYEDDQTRWWEEPDGRPASKGGVLVNAHYDSVSTGFGATDDGVGVVTCLQLIKYFTTPGNAPRRGLVVLFNNAEEDFLNGARVYGQHPISKLAHTFLNLEGTGAGGRATLFRSSDTEVTRPYMNSEHPFGSVLSANGFQMGLIRSQTDYIVFEGDLGLRGLDVAFIEPRARYHTDQDDAKHTNKDSLWHMLSGAVATTDSLVSDSSNDFDGPPRDDGKVSSGSGNQPVWFDLFGSTFVVFRLHTLFALSVTLLIVAPLALLFTSIALTRADKMYLFRSSAKSEDGFEKISLQGLRGFFRFPFLFAIPTAVSVGLAYLVTKINPYIIHSSEYAVWTTMITAWMFLAWFVSRVADFARPSAFHRIYTLTWMFVLMWVLLVIATVYENKYGLAGGYFIFFYFAGVFLATWISYLELFLLPRKSDYASQHSPYSRVPSSHDNRFGSTSGHEDDLDAEEETTETTSLLRNGRRTTFANYTRVGGENTEPGHEEEEEADPNVFGHEQAWSSSIPKWTWLLQFILIAPIVLILVGPLSLLLTTALHQTGQDGSSSLFIYLSIAGLTTLMLNPLLPFVHRYTYHIPVFLLLVFTGTLIYNLVAFPFSETSRLKVKFIQEVDLDTGINKVSLSGVDPFVHDIIHALPSAAGKKITCSPLNELLQCSWDGLTPHVTTDNSSPSIDWTSFNVTKSSDNEHQARFDIKGQNTRACKIVFNTPVTNYHIAGSALDPRFPHNPSPQGTREIRLWSRTWDRTWSVDVEWPEGITLEGKVVCLWSDVNKPGVVPALDEVKQYAPGWVAVTKASDGLVEGSRAFKL